MKKFWDDMGGCYGVALFLLMLVATVLIGLAIYMETR